MNKKGIVGIALFIVAALFTYTFANPNEKIEGKKENNNTDVVEKEQINPVEKIKEVVETPTQVVPVMPMLNNTTLTNNTVINNIQERIIDLTDAKNNAKAELKKYADSKKIENKYKKELQKIINNGNEKIDNSSSEEIINKNLEDTKKLIDELENKQNLELAKENAKKELEQYKKELNFDNYKEYLDNANEIVNDANKIFDESLTVEDILKELETAKNLLDELKKDLMAPAVITLNGKDNIVLTRKITGKDYIDAGINIVKCNSNCTTSIQTKFTEPYGNSSTVFNGVKVSNKLSLIPLNIPKSGTYEIIYTVTNDFGVTSTLTRTVKVARFADEVSAEYDILIDFDENTYNVCRTQYCDESIISSAKAYDYINGKWFDRTNITNRMTVEGNVDTTKIGNYTLKYSVTDWLGYTQTSIRTIKIRDLENPIINFGSLINTKYNNIDIQLPETIVTDNYDEGLTAKIVDYKFDSEDYEKSKTKVRGLITTYKYTIYKKTYLEKVVYEVVDSSGNKTRKTYELPTPVLVSDEYSYDYSLLW